MTNSEFIKDLTYIREIKLKTLSYKIYFDPLNEKLVITDCGKPMAFLSKTLLVNYMFVHNMQNKEWSPFSYDDMKKEIDSLELNCIRDNRLGKLLNEI